MSRTATAVRQERASARPALASASPDSHPAENRLPQHVAIIPDGNRRWAAAQGLPVWDGVRVGVKTAENIFEAIRSRRIPWCTFWAASYDNLTERPAGERGVLNGLFAQWFTNLARNETIRRERVRVRVLGEWPSLLDAPAAQAIESILTATEGHSGPALTFLVGYDGDRELTAAVTALLRQRNSGQGTKDSEPTVTTSDLRRHAWTKDLPEVDILIRTGSWEDPHRSANFLPFLTSNVQEAYPPVYWPAFTDAELDTVLADYARRERRLGR